MGLCLKGCGALQLQNLKDKLCHSELMLILKVPNISGSYKRKNIKKILLLFYSLILNFSVFS